VNSHALEVLEFSLALEAVASRCGSALGREALLRRTPGTDPEPLRAELLRVSEAVALRDLVPDWAPPPPPDARRALRSLSVEGGVPASGELLSLRRLMEAALHLDEGLEPALGEDQTPRFPTLLPTRSALHLDPPELRRLEAIVDDEGSIRDGASPELRRLRQQMRGIRQRIVRRLESFVAALPERIRVADASVALREGRYVIQIRREGRSEVGGVIHGESATGATLFVEPPLALELSRELVALEEAEDREIQRILREVAARLRPATEALEATFHALVDFDTLWARALTAIRWDATLPELFPAEEAGATLVVNHGRHPLLLEKAGADARVIPFDLTLEPFERALVISGPNTGGKTVFLKAMGLFPLLAQTGILPPVGPGTRLPIFRDVLADIGDEQSIAESLSTFSAHLRNAKEILRGAGPGTLVLMDEMGTGTDPAEGAALARAILEVLVEAGAVALVTSHLAALKRLDEAGSGIVNGSLLFDSERIEPTYRFQKGRPGRSYGLAIARRLGIPGSVLDRAEGYVDSGELEVEALLASLEEKERKLTEALEAGRRAQTAAELRNQEVEARSRELRARERSAETRAQEEARRALLEAREEVEAVIQELRAADAESRQALEREARARVEAAARARTEGPRPRRPRPGRSAPKAEAGEFTGPLEPGTRVRIRGSGAKGQVRTVEADRVVVEVGSLRFTLLPGELEPLPDGGSTGREVGSPPAPRPRGGGSLRVPEVQASPEVLLLGLRVEEVEFALGRALDGAVLAHLPSLRIVHGKGTGAVKSRVQELLRADPRVRAFRGGVHGEGGAGVTVAELQ
jgi:DNA mismatch repair protein MutS2